MFSLRKRTKVAPRRPQTGIRETVAGINSQIDHLVTISRDVGSPSSDRVAALETVRSFVEFQSLSSISEIWYAIRGTTALENPAEVRRAGWRLTRSCIDHDEINNSAFTAYYSAIVLHSNVEDFDLVLTCLEHLTKSGRRVVGSQAPRHLPSVLLEWIQMLAVRSQELRSNPSAQDVATQWGTSTEEAFSRLLNYTSNVLKFNMSIWAPIEVEKLLLVVVAIIRNTSQIADCELCCNLMESVIAFVLMPATVLQPVLEVLCGMATMLPTLQSKCYEIVRKLSTSHLQNSTIVRLCCILDSPNAEVTQSMRIAAAYLLKDLLLLDTARSRSADKGLNSRSNILSVLDDSSVSRDASAEPDTTLPVLEVLESYYKTLVDPTISLRLALALLSCFYDLVTEFGLLKRMHTTSWLWLDAEPREGTQSADALKITPIVLTQEFSNLYARMKAEDRTNNQQAQIVNISGENKSTDTGSTAKNDTEIDQFYFKMRELGSVLTDLLSEKSLSASLTAQIMMCVHISHFLDTDACIKLLNAIETVNMCTPGIGNWFTNLKEVVQKVYLERSDNCRIHVLRIVEDIYALDAQQEGWITTEGLCWITKTVFSSPKVSIYTAESTNGITDDNSILDELIQLYDRHIFFSHSEVFQIATDQLVESATVGCLKSVDALTAAFGRAYKLYARQALVVLHALVKTCKQTVGEPAVFAKAWAILCRLRVDRWDRLLLVNHRVEESYNAELRNMQEPLPPLLERIHAIPSLVLKVKTGEPEEKMAEFDTLQILEIMDIVLSSEDTRERTLTLVLINAASQLAHYRLLCSTDLSEKLPLLIKIRDSFEAIVSSGGSKISQLTMPSSARRSACVCVVIHCLTVLIPFKPLFPKAEHDQLVHTLVMAVQKWNLPTGWVVHCFTVACYEAPTSVQRYLPQILSRFQLKITGRDSSMYILDFLLSLSLEGSLTKNFTAQDYKRVFGMCFSFIQNANDLLTLRYQSDITAQWLLRLAYSAISNLFLSMRLENRRSLVPYLIRSLVLATRDPTWVDPMSLVVYDMINRFAYSDVPLRTHLDAMSKLESGWEVKRWMRGLAIIEIRCNRLTGQAVRIVRRPAGIFTTYMTPNVISALQDAFDPLDSEIDETSGGNYTANFYLLCGQLGLGAFRNTHKDSINEKPNQGTQPPGSAAHSTTGSIASNTAPMSNGTSAMAASGTAITNPLNNNNGNHQQSQQPSPNSLTAVTSNESQKAQPQSEGDNSQADTTVSDDYSEHIFGSIVPLALPDDPGTNRAISSIDRVPIVDLYKVGIIYCAPGQTRESEILANTSGSAAYRKFLEGIGVLIRLKHNRMYYLGGLDSEQDLDGKYALAWSSKIWQIIFHTITMMPNTDGDTQFASKKRHIGNNFVNIYFDESGEDFEFDIVKSQFNFINIVITPTYAGVDGSERYWKVRAYRKQQMKNTSAAYDIKVVREENMPLFVRNLALKASQYAAIHNLGAEYMDNWVYRLQLITKLRERIEETNAATLKQKKNEDEEGNAQNDDEYLSGETDVASPSEDIKLLKWMDFTRYTL